MKPIIKFGIVTLIAIFVVIVIFFFKPEDIPPEEYCKFDWDCMPDACCHATGVINKNYMPYCSGMICSAECAPNTLDCAQGEIKCIKHRCTIIWNS